LREELFGATTMIITMAGRRIDAVDAEQRRFPPENVAMVQQRVGAALDAHGATVLVSSAACGADLLALAEAGQRGLRRRIILPFDRERFRETSVTDRPGDWGVLYDRVLDEAEKKGDLLVISVGSENDAYATTNHAIVDEAAAIGERLGKAVIGMLVWDGKSRGSGDLTEEFGAYAKSKGMSIIEVSTI
jgi:hypothetical protein